MAIRVPSYRLHKPSGQAVVRIDGKDDYLGPYDSVESREKYGRLIAQHATGTVASPKLLAGPTGFTVNEVVLAFIHHAKTHYVKDGKQSG